ncbi:MAG: hypothetical protein P8I82_01680 [Flavobacteriales bacterium]|nr:hypothetical protein [Flavobacteriales bacterium]
MKESDFIMICNNHLINPEIAIENEEVRKFLYEAKSKYKNCKTNAVMVALDKILRKQF